MLLDEASENRIFSLLQYGKIHEIDLKALKVKVDLGEETITPFIHLAAPAIDFWVPPKKGEQVVVFSPNSEIDGAFALRGIYSSSNTPPIRDDSVWKIKPEDGLSFGLAKSGKQVTVECEKLAVKNATGELISIIIESLTEISNSTIPTMLGPQTLTGKSKLDLLIQKLQGFKA